MKKIILIFSSLLVIVLISATPVADKTAPSKKVIATVLLKVYYIVAGIKIPAAHYSLINSTENINYGANVTRPISIAANIGDQVSATTYVSGNLYNGHIILTADDIVNATAALDLNLVK
jgi:spore coat protein U-like protein